MGLSSIRDDIANMIRPLGIDAQVQLDFNDSYPNHWYVREFETEIEEREGRGWFPVSLCGEDRLTLRGRRMADAAREQTFGYYDLADAVSGMPLPLPRLNDQWLIYLATDNRILSRPRLIGSPALNPQAHTRLGKAMSSTAISALDDFVGTILEDPSSDEAFEDLRAIILLAHSLGGLPPRTFHIFDTLDERPELGPHLLMHAGERELSSVIALTNGLLFDWATVPVDSWRDAHDAAGTYYMRTLPDLEGQSLQDRSAMIIRLLQQQKAAVTDALPWLVSLLDARPIEDSFDKICDRLFGWSGDRIDRDRHNPFRPDLDRYFPNRRLSSGLARVCDAPVAAACSALGKLELKQGQIMALKDVREHHPQFFREAYTCALGDMA